MSKMDDLIYEGWAEFTGVKVTVPPLDEVIKFNDVYESDIRDQAALSCRLRRSGIKLPPINGTVSVTPGFGDVTITWLPVDRALQYRVYRDAVQVGSVTTPSFYESFLTPGQTYAYEIKAYYFIRESPPKTFNVTLIPLPNPTGLTTTPNTGSVQLSWNSMGLDYTYKVYRLGVFIAALSGTSYNDTGLDSDTLYTYTVKSVKIVCDCSTSESTGTQVSTRTLIPVQVPIMELTQYAGQTVLGMNGTTLYGPDLNSHQNISFFGAGNRWWVRNISTDALAALAGFKAMRVAIPGLTRMIYYDHGSTVNHYIWSTNRRRFNFKSMWIVPGKHLGLAIKIRGWAGGVQKYTTDWTDLDGIYDATTPKLVTKNWKNIDAINMLRYNGIYGPTNTDADPATRAYFSTKTLSIVPGSPGGFSFPIGYADIQIEWLD